MRSGIKQDARPKLIQEQLVSDVKKETTENPEPSSKPAKEVGGRKGPEPTRYGDWEKNGIASDF